MNLWIPPPTTKIPYKLNNFHMTHTPLFPPKKKKNEGFECANRNFESDKHISIKSNGNVDLWNNKIHLFKRVFNRQNMKWHLFQQTTDSKIGASITTIAQIVESNAFLEFEIDGVVSSIVISLIVFSLNTHVQFKQPISSLMNRILVFVCLQMKEWRIVWDYGRYSNFLSMILRIIQKITMTAKSSHNRRKQETIKVEYLAFENWIDCI